MTFEIINHRQTPPTDQESRESAATGIVIFLLGGMAIGALLTAILLSIMINWG